MQRSTRDFKYFPTLFVSINSTKLNIENTDSHRQVRKRGAVLGD
jgi:hypothetical protein